MRKGHNELSIPLRTELITMIAEVAVKQTENHLEILSLIKGESLEIGGLQTGLDMIKADLSALKNRVLTMEINSEKRHEELLQAIRSLRGVPGSAFAL